MSRVVALSTCGETSRVARGSKRVAAGVTHREDLESGAVDAAVGWSGQLPLVTRGVLARAHAEVQLVRLKLRGILRAASLV